MHYKCEFVLVYKYMSLLSLSVLVIDELVSAHASCTHWAHCTHMYKVGIGTVEEEEYLYRAIQRGKLNLRALNFSLLNNREGLISESRHEIVME